MKKATGYVLGTLIGLHLFANSLIAYDTTITHPDILTKQCAYIDLTNPNSPTPSGLLIILCGSEYKEIAEYFDKVGSNNDLREGSIDEDAFTMDHFYDPAKSPSEAGLWSYQTALLHARQQFNLAVNYYITGDKEKAYYELGKCLHLATQDMSCVPHMFDDEHPFGLGSYEKWWKEDYADPNINPNAIFPLGTIVQPITSLEDAVNELAVLTYKATRIQGSLYDVQGNPTNGSGELKAMFPDLRYSGPDPNTGKPYWSIPNIGDFGLSGWYLENTESNDWWRCANFTPQSIAYSQFGTPLDPIDAEYYYIEQPRRALINGKTLAEIWALNKGLINTSINYTAGLLKYFYDLVNEPPYLKHVTVTQNATFCYDAYWDWSQGQTDRTLTPNTQQARNPKSVNDQSDATITIEFSEPVKDVHISVGSVPSTGTLSQDLQSWTGTLTVNNIQSLGTGDKHLTVSAKDLTDQVLDSNPQSIAFCNPNTNQKEDYEPNSDTLHHFTIGDATPPVISFSIPGGVYNLGTNVIVTYSLIDNLDPNPQITFASHPSGTVFNQAGTYVVTVSAKDASNNIVTSRLGFSIAVAPTRRPDDNYSISNGTLDISGEDTTSKCKVAVLNEGLVSPTLNLLTAIKEPYRLINVPINAELLSQYPLLIIPSGGFNGISNSDTVKNELASYANNGGVIFSLTQGHGYDFNVLPSGGFYGIGFDEDQGCLSNAAGVENQHIIFAGQPEVYIDANVDGYFNVTPQGSTVLLRRTKNRMPCLIEYNYGGGKLLVSTLYSDFAYLNGQLTPSELQLFSDITAYAKDFRKPIEQIKPYESITMTVPIKYMPSSLPEAQITSSVIQNIYNSRNILVKSEEFACSLLPGQEMDSNMVYYADNNLGIYTISYVLKDSLGNITQEETTACKFAVAKDIGTVNLQKDINITVKSAQQFYPVGSPGVFLITVYNNGSQTEDLDVKYTVGNSSGSSTVNILANSSLEIPVTESSIQSNGTFSCDIYEKSTGELIIGATENFMVYYPEMDLKITADQSQYTASGKAILNVSMSNRKQFDFNGQIEITITDPGNNVIYENVLSRNIEALTSTQENIEFSLPAIAQKGFYVVQAKAISGGNKVGTANTFFEIPLASLTISPVLPEIFSHDNTVKFRIKNTGIQDISSVTLKIAMQDPLGAIVWQKDVAIENIATSQEQELSYQIGIPDIKYGNYTLNYELNEGTVNIKDTLSIPNTAILETSFDKPDYKVRENMQGKVRLINSGKWEQNLDVAIAIPEINFMQNDSCGLAPTQSVEFPFTVYLPETISSGLHQVKVSLKTAGEANKEEDASFAISPSILIAKPISNTPDTSEMSISNTGGVDTQCQYIIQLIDSKGITIHTQPDTIISVKSGETAPIVWKLPEDLCTNINAGSYYLRLVYYNLKYNLQQELLQSIDLGGVLAALNIATSKNIYNLGENIQATGSMTSNQPLSGATLNIKITSANPAWTNYTNTDGIIKIIPNGNNIWFATAGAVRRYDQLANTWRTWTTAEGLGGSYITNMISDTNGIWVSAGDNYYFDDFSLTRIDNSGTCSAYRCGIMAGTYVHRENDAYVLFKGCSALALFSKIDQTWQNISYGNDVPLPGAQNAVFTGNSIWALISDSLVRYDLTTKIVTNVASGLIGIGSTLNADGDTIWFGTSNGVLYKYMISGNHLENIAIGANITCMVVSDKDVWIGSGFNSLLRYDKTSGQISSFPNIYPAISDKNFMTSEEDQSFAFDDDYVWIATHTGLKRYTRSSNEWQTYTTADGLLSNYTTSVAISGEFVWIGTPVGMSRYQKNSDWNCYTDDNSVKEIINGTADNAFLWFNSINGLLKYDTDQKKFSHFPYSVPYTGFDMEKTLAIDDNFVWSLTQSPPKLVRFDKAQQTWIDIDLAKALNNLNCSLVTSCMYADANYLWTLGTSNILLQPVILSYNKQSEQWQQYPLPVAAINQSIMVDQKYIWVGGSTVLRFDKTTGQVATPINLTNITAIADGGQYLWLAVGGTGICLYKVEKETGIIVDTINVPEYNISINNVYGGTYDVLAVDGQSLWIAVVDLIGNPECHFGVVRYDTITRTWKLFTEADGLIGGGIEDITVHNDFVWFTSYLGISSYRRKGSILWEKQIPINNTTAFNYQEAVMQIKESGKFYIEGTVTSELGQHLADDQNSFYVSNKGVIVTLAPDKQMYKPGEDINITGEVVNISSLSEPNVQYTISRDGAPIFNGTVSLEPNQKTNFNCLTESSQNFILSGKAVYSDNNSSEISQPITIANPQVEITVTGPEVSGQDSFDLGILVKNTGQLSTVNSLQLTDGSQNKDLGEFTLKSGETKYFSQTYQIDKDTNFEINLTGDLTKSITKTVKFGCMAAVTITPAAVYPASSDTSKEIWEIPIIISNQGSADMHLSLLYTLNAVSGNWHKEIGISYYVPPAAIIEDNLVFEGVPKGDYVLDYTSDLTSGSVLVRVAEFNQIQIKEITANNMELVDGKISATLKVKNIGANVFIGNIIRCLELVAESENTKAWEEAKELTLAINEEKTFNFEIPAINLTAGKYNIVCGILHNGTEINSGFTPLDLKPNFVIKYLDDNKSYDAASQGEFTVTLINTGLVSGIADIALAGADFIANSKQIPMAVNQEQTVYFNFNVPAELEQKTYGMMCTVKDVQDHQQINKPFSIKIRGNKVAVIASLDKELYQEGETAHLTLTINNIGALCPVIYAKANFNDYQSTTPAVLLNNNEPLILNFAIPVHFTGQKIFYGIYLDGSNYGLYFNNLYIHRKQEKVSLFTDKQVFNPGEDVQITIKPEETGQLSLKGPKFEKTINIASLDEINFSFPLPAEMVTGQYFLEYNYAVANSTTVLNGKYPIDVLGYIVSFMEEKLNQKEYYPGNDLVLGLRIESDRDINDYQLKGWLRMGNEVIPWEKDKQNLIKGQNYVEISLPMIFNKVGSGWIIYGLYKQTLDGELLLCADQQLFDVVLTDGLPPETQIQLEGARWKWNDKTYITDKSQMYFVATDSGTSPAGIDFTEYAVDASTWTVYASSFTLSGEGEHTVKYRSRDKAGNIEETKQAAYYLDNTSSLSQITVNSSTVTVNNEQYIISPASFTVTATDTLAGVDFVEYAVDNSTPIKTGYQNPIEIISDLADGSHLIKYFSVDKLGNKEAEKTLSFLIDGNAPVTEMQIQDPRYQTPDKTYISQDSKIKLTATDAGVGLDKISYRVDAGTTTIYTEQFGLTQEGMHTIFYSATDQLGNVEAEKNYVLYVDTKTPETSLQPSDSSYQVIEGTTTYVNSNIPLFISAIDPESNGVSSGLKHIKTKLDANNYSTILSSSSYISADSPDGLHTISYYAVDNVENTETVKTYAAIFDGTKPLVKSTYPANNAKVKAKQAVPITITFSEPVKSIDWSKDIILQEAKGRKIQDYSISYDSATYTVSINGKLKNNTEYEVILKSTISDRVRNYLDACSFSFRTTMLASEGGTFSDTATGLTVIVPPNCLPCDGYFEIALLDQINPPKLPKPLKWLFDGRKAYQVIFFDVDGNIVQQQVKQAFKVVLVLRQQWIALAMESDPIEYKNIKVYQTGSVSDFVASMAQQGVSSSSEKSQFAPRLLAEQSYNAQEQELMVEMDSFGMFALAGFNAPGISLDDLSCYPNPFNPCKQDITIQYYLENDSDVAIAIYDLLGNLVKTWEIPSGDMNARTGLNQLTWNGRNGSGDIVANGGYIVFVHSDGQKKKFKVLVVK